MEALLKTTGVADEYAKKANNLVVRTGARTIKVCDTMVGDDIIGDLNFGKDASVFVCVEVDFDLRRNICQIVEIRVFGESGEIFVCVFICSQRLYIVFPSV